MHDVIANLVYVGTNRVAHVWVAGKQLVADGRVLGLDEQALMERGNAWATRIVRKHAATTVQSHEASK